MTPHLPNWVILVIVHYYVHKLVINWILEESESSFEPAAQDKVKWVVLTAATLPSHHDIPFFRILLLRTWYVLITFYSYFVLTILSGYGHATRVSAFATHLLGLDIAPIVYIISSAPKHVFSQAIDHGAYYRNASIDPVIVQPLA